MLLPLLAAAMPQIAIADEEVFPQMRFAVLVGAHEWNSLGDLQSASGGQFDSTGVSVTLAWHRDIVEFQHTTLLAGGELGFFTNESSFENPLDDLIARGIYLVPSLKLAFGRQRNVYIDAGIGLYSADFVEFDCDDFDFGCSETDETWSESRLGGLVGAGIDFDIDGQWALALEAKVHFVDFGSVSGLDTSSQKLDGPIYMLQFGAAF